ncbi:MAG: methyl-accepting chemotaxis protein, partial [Smithella sp.]
LVTAITEKAKSDAATSLEVINLMYPGDWSNKDGVLYKGTIKINDNTEIVDKISKLTDDSVTIFLNDTRIATTILVDGKRGIGTKADDHVINTVLYKGETYRGDANVLGVNYHTNYIPIKDADGTIIGMFYLGASKQFADELEQGFIIKFIGTILVSLFFFSLIGWYLGCKLAKPIGAMAQMAGQIAKGNLNVKEIAITSKDEIGELSQGINTMLHSLKILIGKIFSSSDNVAVSSSALTASAQQSAEAANQVAGSICQIAAGSDKQTMAVNNILAVVKEISVDITQIASVSKEIKSNAIDAAKSTEQGHSAIDRTVEQMRNIDEGADTVVKTIEKLAAGSKEIGEIVTLISSIAGQTNLLALNAAIEAASAGEAGRGFAVVAEEVRRLAEQSEQAAQKIAERIQRNEADVIQAITATRSSNECVKAGSEVVKTAGEVFKSIADTVEHLSLRIKDVTQSIDHIAQGSRELFASVQHIDKLSRENTSETQNVSAAMEEQSASMQEIAASSRALVQISTELKTMVAEFKL